MCCVPRTSALAHLHPAALALALARQRCPASHCTANSLIKANEKRKNGENDYDEEVTDSPSLLPTLPNDGTMPRQVLQYVDLDAPAADTPRQGSTKVAFNGSGLGQGGQVPAAIPGQSRPLPPMKQWTDDGMPISASAARKYRKLMTRLSSDEIELAHEMLATESMAPARRSVEVQAALSAACSRRQNGQAHHDGLKNVHGAMETELNGNYAATHSASIGASTDEESIEPGMPINLHGSVADGHTQSGRQLTHAEIWDDGALVDAWDAAMQEYETFDKQRDEASKANATSSSFAIHSGDGKQARAKSALWYEAPAVGSVEAMEARQAASARRSEEDAARAAAAQEAQELQVRKAHAKTLLREISDGQTQGSEHATGSASHGLTHPSSAKRRRKARGVVPPSSSIQGNATWHLACATVSQTPNRIGNDAASDDNCTGQEAAAGPAEALPYATPTAAAASHAADADEVLQNYAMSWYYAGYYQALASAMMTGGTRGAGNT